MWLLERKVCKSIKSHMSLVLCHYLSRYWCCYPVLRCVTFSYPVLPFVTLFTFVTLCYHLLPFCYPVLPLLPCVPLCYPVLPYVTLCYPVLPFITPCYPLLPCVSLCYPVLPFVALCYPVLPFLTLRYPVFPCVTFCFPVVSFVTLHKYCLQFLLGRLNYPREMKNKGYAKFWEANKVHCRRFAIGECCFFIISLLQAPRLSRVCWESRNTKLNRAFYFRVFPHFLVSVS